MTVETFFHKGICFCCKKKQNVNLVNNLSMGRRFGAC